MQGLWLSVIESCIKMMTHPQESTLCSKRLFVIYYPSIKMHKAEIYIPLKQINSNICQKLAIGVSFHCFLCYTRFTGNCLTHPDNLFQSKVEVHSNL